MKVEELVLELKIEGMEEFQNQLEEVEEQLDRILKKQNKMLAGPNPFNGCRSNKRSAEVIVNQGEITIKDNPDNNPTPGSLAKLIIKELNKEQKKARS